ncbi:DUF6176 family protein [Halorubellus litoreus]|uniref:DUF6176 family protein n=1 Tax=Halorubellus litoreus TaxID=755308 RepID=A0ABD5VM42_9EURY
MTEVQLARCEVRSGKEDRIRDWYETLANDRFSETAASLVSEGTLTESAFLQQNEGGASYLYVLMEWTDSDDAPPSADETLAIVEEHHDVLAETLVGEDWEELEPLGHMVNPER